MKHPDPRKQPKAFDIHRTLPHSTEQLARSDKTKPHRSKPKPDWKRRAVRSFLLVLAIFLILILVVGVWDAKNIGQASQKMFGTSNLFNLLNPTGAQTDSNGRINILIAGYSIDDPGHQAATLTDSIILLSMKPANHTGYMLSIPRDLYVNIPGFGHAKINEAYNDGGMELLQQVVQKDFNMQIPYWALVDYTAVKDTVDALGGIDITINSPDGRLYDPNKDWSTNGPLVDLSNGQHHLSGQQALDLTRARGDPNPYGVPVGFEQSDYQRTLDQRQVFTAIKSKLNWTIILNPRKNGKILNAVASNVKTNLKAGEARPVFGAFNRIPSSQLQSFSLRDINGKSYVSGYTTYDGLSAQIPSAGIDDYSAIENALQQLN